MATKEQIATVMKRCDELGLAPAVKVQIRHNIDHGLLCACNQAKVPYFPSAGMEQAGHGMIFKDYMLHGYEHCVDARTLAHDDHLTKGRP